MSPATTIRVSHFICILILCLNSLCHFPLICTHYRLCCQPSTPLYKPLLSSLLLAILLTLNQLKTFLFYFIFVVWNPLCIFSLSFLQLKPWQSITHEWFLRRAKTERNDCVDNDIRRGEIWVRIEIQFDALYCDFMSSSICVRLVTLF